MAIRPVMTNFSSNPNYLNFSGKKVKQDDSSIHTSKSNKIAIPLFVTALSLASPVAPAMAASNSNVSGNGTEVVQKASKYKAPQTVTGRVALSFDIIDSKEMGLVPSLKNSLVLLDEDGNIADSERLILKSSSGRMIREIDLNEGFDVTVINYSDGTSEKVYKTAAKQFTYSRRDDGTYQVTVSSPRVVTKKFVDTVMELTGNQVPVNVTKKSADKSNDGGSSDYDYYYYMNYLLQ